MPGKGKKKSRAPSSDIALMVWLTGAPYLIMRVLDSSPQNPTEVGKVLGKSVSWVSKRTGRMVKLGLIVKDGPDDRGMVNMTLTDKGKNVMDAITGIIENPLFAELRRALDLKVPDDSRRAAVKKEAERLMWELTDNKDGGDTKRLHEAALNASSMKVEGWYATEALTQLLSTIGTHPWDERSRLLLIKIARMAIADSRNDRRYAKAYNGLVEPLRRLASDDNADVNTRAEVIIAIASFRDSEGQIPDGALMAILQVQWEALKPGHVGADLIEDAISETLRKWAPLLKEAQREMLSRSVYRMSRDAPPAIDDPMEEIISGNPRNVDRRRWERYRSLVATLLDRDIVGEVHATGRSIGPVE